MEKEISSFYDKYADRQLRTGINERHYSILKWLKSFGLKRDDDILEVGCGVGTLTSLLAKFIKSRGSITAIDISPKSIESAKRILSCYDTVQFISGDITNYPLDNKFNVIVLPDVIEHIPLDQHFSLFQKLYSLLHDDGFVLIHIPNPYYLEWCHQTRPDLLQVVDQPIHTDQLSKNVYPNGFYIHYLKTYSIWQKNNDYQVVVLKKSVYAGGFNIEPAGKSSFWQIVLNKGVRIFLNR